MAAGAEAKYGEAKGGETGAPANPLSRNMVARKGFPHRAAHTLWMEGYLKYAEACAKQNQKDFEEAKAVIRNGTGKDAPGGSPFEEHSDTRVATNIAYSDLTKLLSFVMHRDPKPRCNTAKGPRLKGGAKAVEKLTARVYREMSYSVANRACLVEALLREHGNVRQGWDHYRCLPTWTHCENEVYWDPDGSGDPKKCKYVMAIDEMPLHVILDDPEIDKGQKARLKEATSAHRKTRADGDNFTKAKEYESEGAAWDNQPQMKKVLVVRVWSIEGVLPGSEGNPEAGEDANGREMATPHGIKKVGAPPNADGEDVDALEEEMRHNPHAGWRPPPEVQDDAPPEAPNYDPEEAGRRVYMVFVKDFKEVLKVTPWPMRHYDRGEWPILECNFLRLPGDVHGIPWYRVIKENIDLINKALQTAINDVRYGARKIIEVEEGLFDANADEIQKLSNPKNQYEVVKVQHINGIKVTEFAGRDKSYLNLIPIIKDLHDEATGVNDVVRGQSGEVQKTKYEAQQLADQTAAALAYLQEAIERFLEEQARLTVGALLCYVERESEWTEPEPCLACEGKGTVASDAFADLTPVGAPPAPCPRCQGSGVDPMPDEPPKVIKRGADFWLEDKDAAEWPEGLSIDEIRAEIVVGIKSGSTRRDYVEREVNTLRNAGQDLTLIYDKLDGLVPGAGLRKQIAYAEEILNTLGVDEPERFLVSDEELQGILQQQQMMQQQAMQAEVAMKAGPPEDPAIQEAEEAKASEESARAEAEMGAKAHEVEVKREVEARKLAMEEEKHAAEMERIAADRAREDAKVAAEAAPQAALASGVQETMAGLASLVQQVAQTVAVMQQGAAAQAEATVALVGAVQGMRAEGQANAAAMIQAAQSVAAAAAAPKRVVRDAQGQIAGVEPVA